MQKLPRLSRIDVAVAAFAVWTVVNDAFIQQRECKCYCGLATVLLCYAGIRMLRHKSELVLGLIAAWSMVEAVVSVMQFCGFAESNHLLFSVTGTFRNPGPLGGFLAVGVTVFAGLAVHGLERKSILMILAAALGLVAVMLAVADSRAGWLAAIVGMAFLYWPQIFRLWQRCKVYVKASIVIIAVCFLLAMYLHKAQSAAGRLLIWRVTADMVADSPVTGHGSGSFAEKYMYYQADYFKNHTDSMFADRAGDRSFNDLLRAWSEGGIVAVAIICFIACNIDWKAPGKQRIVNAAIISVAAFAMFSYPSCIIHFQLLCAALLACTSCKGCAENKERNATFIGSMLLAACCGMVAYSQTREANAADGEKSSPEEFFRLFAEELRSANRDIHNVSTSHAVLNIISDPRTASSRVMEMYHITPDMLREDIDRFLGGGSKADEPEARMLDCDNEQPSGPGVAPMLAKFGVDLTRLAREGKIDPVTGREREIERVIQILSRRKKNNPILIGEAGVGKSAVVEGLALRIASGDVPYTISNKTIFSLDVSSLVAGTKFRGEFEERMQQLLDEIRKSRNTIIFIDEIHTIVGAGSTQGSLDTANILKPALARGELQTIGATTLDEYRENIERDSALERRFQKVIIELKDKISRGGAELDLSGGSSAANTSEACSALVMLGFTKNAVEKTVASIVKKEPGLSLEDIIKKALKML